MCSEGSKHISFPLFFRDLTTQYPYRTQNYFCSVSRFALRPYPIGLLMECFEYIPPVCIYFVSLLFSSLQIHYRCQGYGVLQHFFFFPVESYARVKFPFLYLPHYLQVSQPRFVAAFTNICVISNTYSVTQIS